MNDKRESSLWIINTCGGHRARTSATSRRTTMLRFNDEWHGATSTPSNFMRTQLYLRYWFDKWRGAGKVTTTSAQPER